MCSASAAGWVLLQPGDSSFPGRGPGEAGRIQTPGPEGAEGPQPQPPLPPSCPVAARLRVQSL